MSRNYHVCYGNFMVLQILSMTRIECNWSTSSIIWIIRTKISKSQHGRFSCGAAFICLDCSSYLNKLSFTLILSLKLGSDLLMRRTSWDSKFLLYLDYFAKLLEPLGSPTRTSPTMIIWLMANMNFMTTPRQGNLVTQWHRSPHRIRILHVTATN